jgi:predicted phage terminase large subunit-like protein
LPTVFTETLPPTIAEALLGPEQIKLIIGGVRTGKSKAVMRYMLAHCRKYAAQFPGQTIRWVVVRDTYENVSGTNLKTLLELEPRGRWGRWNEQKKTFTVAVPKGQFAEIKFFGLDDPDDIVKLQSLDLSGFVICEPAGGLDAETERIGAGVPADAYLMCLNRLSHPIGLQRTVGILEGNAPSAGHWVAKLLRDQARVEIVPVMSAAGLPTGRVRREEIPGRTASILLANVPAWEAPILHTRPDYYENLESLYASTGKGSAYIRRYLRGEWLPVLSGGLDRTHVPTIPRDDCPPFDAIVATLDPSTGAAKGDRSALAVCGVTRGGFAYLLDLQVGRFEYAELIERLFAMQARWAPGVVGIEAVGFQKWLDPILREKEPARGVRIPRKMLERDSKQSKELRIETTLCVRVSEGRLIVVEGCANVGELWAEMEAFGASGGHDDVLDALADLDQVVGLAFPAADVGIPDGGRPRGGSEPGVRAPLFPQLAALGEGDRGAPLDMDRRFWSRRPAGFWRG